MVTLSYKDLLIGVLLICAIVLIIYLIGILRKLGPILNNLSQISEDAKKLTAEAINGVDEIKKVSKKAGDGVEKISSSVGNVVNLLDGNKNTVKALTNITNATAGLVNLFKK